jgi:hypothetical protein
MTAPGRPFTATSIQILRIREGHIELFRGFADPRILENVIGEPRLPGRARWWDEDRSRPRPGTACVPPAWSR